MEWSNQIDPEIVKIIQELYANDSKKLHQMCYKELSKFGGLSQMDYDDFYSRVGWEVSLIVKSYENGNPKYDPDIGKSFAEYLIGVVRQSIWKELTKKNRKKRCLFEEYEETDENGEIRKVKRYLQNLSLDAPIEDDDSAKIADLLISDFDIEREVFEDEEDVYSQKALKYLNRLSIVQRDMLELIIAGYLPNEIREELHITEKQYRDNYAAIHSYRNVSILF